MPFFCSFLSSFPWAHLLFLGTSQGGGQRGACNEPPARGLRTGKLGKMYAAMIYIGRMRVDIINKKKKKKLVSQISYGVLTQPTRAHKRSPKH